MSDSYVSRISLLRKLSVASSGIDIDNMTHITALLNSCDKML